VAEHQRIGRSYLAERNEGVLGSVVVVNVQVAAGAQAHAPAAVLGQGVQHVVEEADAGVDADGPGRRVRGRSH
jgi:hypothetical protein